MYAVKEAVLYGSKCMIGCIRPPLMEQRALCLMNVPSEARVYFSVTVRPSGFETDSILSDGNHSMAFW